ncbi:MAG TPA: type II toxin-antitoxin system RelE/ParE family toxin [Kofleriaceae bacterium]|jgi:toxin ParE1/3/4
MNLRLHRLAVEEIDYEVDYYESFQSGLGTELQLAVDASLELILQFPNAGSPWKHRENRRILVLERFPFMLPYQIVGEVIYVLALAHMRRRPGYWSRRG